MVQWNNGTYNLFEENQALDKEKKKNEIIGIIQELSEEDLYYFIEILQYTMRE
jgi:hypothetical protein